MIPFSLPPALSVKPLGQAYGSPPKPAAGRGLLGAICTRGTSRAPQLQGTVWRSCCLKVVLVHATMTTNLESVSHPCVPTFIKIHCTSDSCSLSPVTDSCRTAACVLRHSALSLAPRERKCKCRRDARRPNKFLYADQSTADAAFTGHLLRFIESLRLEKTSKITQSNRQPNSTTPAEPRPEVPYLYVL